MVGGLHLQLTVRALECLLDYAVSRARTDGAMPSAAFFMGVQRCCASAWPPGARAVMSGMALEPAPPVVVGQ
ncbi:hypothetical protein GCM10009549_39210 [Streptomyces thermoalcalitolerans]|uniref:Uncharacterized protein n=1 Tax=Streptomyces thermoalcalitolerans TaxID=65605 RepID=A0ABP3ZI94_9ACTN